MGTRCTIWMELENKSYKGIYCHYDGYIDHTGKILYKYYNTLEKVKELIDGGHISFLGRYYYPQNHEPHSFENPAENVTIVYARDRNDPLENFREITLARLSKYQPVTYLFKDNSWYMVVPRNKLLKITFDDENNI